MDNRIGRKIQTEFGSINTIMSAGSLHFDDDQYPSLKKEETFDVELTWNQPNKTPVNITGYTAKLQVRKNYGNPVILELTTENGGIALTALTGKIRLIVPASATKTLPVGKFLYDLLMISGSNVQTLVKGEFHIKDGVTVL